MAPFPTRLDAPLLWERPVCDCHWYYQFYLCGCPDRTVLVGSDRSRHVPSFQGCSMWHRPYWEKAMADRYGFQHNTDPPVRNEPSVLPFPCYRHLMEARVFLPPPALHQTRSRLLDPKWNPVSAARRNLNTHRVQLFQKQGRTWEGKKRVRDEDDDDDAVPPRPARRRKGGEPEIEPITDFQQRLQKLELQGVVDEYRRRIIGAMKTAPGFNLQDPPTRGTYRVPSWPSPASPPSLPCEVPLSVGSSASSASSASSEESASSGFSSASTYIGYSETVLSAKTSPPPSPPSSSASSATIRPMGVLSRETSPETWPPTCPIQDSYFPPYYPPSPDRQPPTTTTATTTTKSHFTSLTWLLEEQLVDLWAQDGYRHRCAPPAPPSPPSSLFFFPPTTTTTPLLSIEQHHQQQQQANQTRAANENQQRRNDGIVRYVPHDGPTHRGYHGGAYKFDEGVLMQARVANWWGADPEGRWAALVGEWWFVRGGGTTGRGWFGGGLSME